MNRRTLTMTNLLNLTHTTGRGRGEQGQTSTRRTPRRASVSPGLDRVRTAARLDRKERFTALLHHVDAGLLRRPTSVSPTGDRWFESCFLQQPVCLSSEPCGYRR